MKKTKAMGCTPASLSGAAKVKVADINKDGKPDLLTANNTSDDISVVLAE